MTSLPLCPALPQIADQRKAVSLRELGTDRGPAFYERALECAQSRWIEGLPGQAILMLNRAYSADLNGREGILCVYPLPYAALRWILEHHQPEHYLGNPRRHFQHLATRMVEPRKTIRTWRAWACWAIAGNCWSQETGDPDQLRVEGVREPGLADIREGLEMSGLPGEAELWLGAILTGS